MIPKLSGAFYAIRSGVHISNINTHINLLYVLPFCYKIWNNFFGYLFQQWEDFHFTKENHQIYGCCTTQNLLQKSTETIRDSPYSVPVYTLINELQYKK